MNEVEKPQVPVQPRTTTTKPISKPKPSAPKKTPTKPSSPKPTRTPAPKTAGNIYLGMYRNDTVASSNYSLSGG